MDRAKRRDTIICIVVMREWIRSINQMEINI